SSGMRAYETPAWPHHLGSFSSDLTADRLVIRLKPLDCNITMPQTAILHTSVYFACGPFSSSNCRAVVVVWGVSFRGLCDNRAGACPSFLSHRPLMRYRNTLAALAIR